MLVDVSDHTMQLVQGGGLIHLLDQLTDRLELGSVGGFGPFEE